MDTVFPHMSMHVRTRDLFGVGYEEQVWVCPVLDSIWTFKDQVQIYEYIMNFSHEPQYSETFDICSLGIFICVLRASLVCTAYINMRLWILCLEEGPSMWSPETAAGVFLTSMLPRHQGIWLRQDIHDDLFDQEVRGSGGRAGRIRPNHAWRPGIRWRILLLILLLAVARHQATLLAAVHAVTGRVSRASF